MKRFLVILLILIAIPLWMWNTNLVLKGAFAHKKHSKAAIKTTLTAMNSNGTITPHFEPKGRSPFTPFKEAPKPKAAANTVKKNVNKPVANSPVNPPPISINSIMWNESNPVAIINLQDGSSTIAKKGQTLAGGITVKTIEKNQVEVEFNGTSFWIKK